jgi:epoxide hydrolase 4
MLNTVRAAGSMIAALLLTSCAVHVPTPPPDWAGPWEHLYVELPDRVDGAPLRMHYLAAGPVDAPRVVLLHGFPDLSYGWRGVLPELSTDHRVLAPDLRGYGGTDRPEGGYDIKTLVGDIDAFITMSATADGVEDATVDLIGHDWGAALGWWVAMDHADRLRSYTAISVPHPTAWARFLEQDEPQRKKATYQDALARRGVASLLSSMSERRQSRLYRDELRDQSAMSDADWAVYWGAYQSSADWGPPLQYYQELKADRADHAAALAVAPPISIPVLVLWGEEDSFLFPRQASMSCEHVSPAVCEVEVFENAAHWLPWDLPKQIVARWRTFTNK